MGAVLSYDFQVQINGYYCGPAATRVALTARNVFPTQTQVAASLGTTTAGTDSSNNVVRTLNAYLGAGTYDATFIAGNDATVEQRDEFRRDVQSSIDAGYAVVCNVVGTIHTNDGSSYTYNGGHYVTVVGYDDLDNVLVADIAIREYWTTVAKMATWIAGRGYSSSTVTAPLPPEPGTPPPWPSYMPAGHYFGLITGPAESHGGFYPAEQPDVMAIQKQLQALGYAPSGDGWADGLFEQATFDAVSAWQHAKMPGTTRFGEIWSDDWAALFAPVVTEPEPTPVPPTSPPVEVGDTFLIVDLASWQDPSDLSQFKAAGVRAVNIKTSGGMSYVWDKAQDYASQARINGLGISTFHWLDSSGSGMVQAQKAYELMKVIGNGSTDGLAHQCDCEDDAPYQTVSDYITEMQRLLGRPILFYTGDWWIQTPERESWNIRGLTPYLWAGPNDGYRTSYPGDNSSDWHAGYAGYDTMSALQFAVQPISGAPGNVSKTMMRKGAWAILTTPVAVIVPPSPTTTPVIPLTMEQTVTAVKRALKEGTG